MSKSRLEKFLYALYSLDSSDLPHPLSRIEELYKCLVTREEVPTFEPLSRVEKYLMAILGVYDADELPNPLSRVEVLLYKLATGDDNLDDVKSFLSEHEELLAEIIRNGGVGGNIDIEYVLYALSTRHDTLYNTAEKPVKSAILKGQTLVNLLPNKGKQHVSVSGNRIVKYPLLHTLKKNTKYLVYYNVEDISNPSGSNSLQISMYSKDVNVADFIDSIDKTGLRKHIFTTSDKDFEQPSVWFFVFNGETTEAVFDEVMILEYQDGMENWDIPYFEGMKSVQMPVLTTTGKNLFDMSEIVMSDFEQNKYQNVYYGKEIQLQPNTTYTIKPYLISEITNTNVWTVFNLIVNGVKTEVVNANYTGSGADKKAWNTHTFETDETGVVGYSIYCHKDKEESWFGNLPIEVQLEVGSIATLYEPYKSNILTVNEEVELREIGDVKDELNLLTGELTTRTRKVVYNSNDMIVTKYRSKENTFTLLFNDKSKATRSIMADKIPVVTGWSSFLDNFNLCCSSLLSSYIYVTIPNVNTPAEAITYLSNLNPTFLYILAEESIKTVDLSAVDQDGNNTKLSTFDDITHVTLSSEGLIPEAELEVATKNEEDLEDSIVYTVHTLSEKHNTLYNTAEKPIKSAILKGKTLVNLHKLENYSVYGVVLDGGINQHFGNDTSYSTWRMFDISMLKPNTEYGVFCWVLENTISGKYWDGHYHHSADTVFNPSTELRFSAGEIGLKFAKLTTISDFTGKTCGIRHLININTPSSEYVKFRCVIVEYQEGMENWDIPYFEGMQSVKMPVLKTTGKNLFNVETVKKGYTLSGDSGLETYNAKRYISDFIYVKGITHIAITNTERTQNIWSYDENKQPIRKVTNNATNGNFVVSIPSDVSYIRLPLSTINQDNITDEIIQNNLVQVEAGEQFSSYKPYKSNILTVNEDVTLRSNGDICDELNLLTRQLTQRIGEDGVVLSQEVVKTVDLSVVDQDGNNTELSTFDDITHVTLSSEGLIPESELEVAEKVPEVAASMLTISREQEVINVTTNEQSENVDATMIATTEIYEGLL